MRKNSQIGITRGAMIGVLIIAVILVLGTVWTGRSASSATQEAVRSVSLMYLDELAGRREQVIESNLKENIKNMEAAISLIEEEDLSDLGHFQAFQEQMKQLYGLEIFAFVDSDGLIYTAKGIQTNIDSYAFDYKNLSEASISVMDPEAEKKTVVIAIPVEKDHLSIDGKKLAVCFMEIDMVRMLDGVSMSSDKNDTTFCNIYTKDGISLTHVVLGGLASDENLLMVLKDAEFENDYSQEAMAADFEAGEEGVVSFVYNDIRETLYYVPINGTDWMLTYLIRESVITNQIRSVTQSIITRSLIMSILTAAVLFVLFVAMIIQTRRNARLIMEKETADALLELEKQRTQQSNMITALASDYRSVYYVDLDTDDSICYQVGPQLGDDEENPAPLAGEHFSFQKRFREYADRFVEESYKEGFYAFIDPENIRKGLKQSQVITYRYLVNRGGKEVYEMLRMAGVRHLDDRDDSVVYAVGVGFADVDRDTRESLARAQALGDALKAAEEASKAKTAFLSNMSHEIRTPMNAIIGLDNIALNDPDISDATRDQLEKIGSSAQHLLVLINDILDMSRIESGRMTLKNEEFSFAKLLEQVNAIFNGQCSEKGLQYNCQINGEVDDYYIGDNIKLRQILINILGNAVKFTPAGGSVDLIVERIARFNDQTTLQFVMRDTGIGISEDYLPKIFDAFSQEDSSSTNKYGSSGLGLAITKNIVEMMNGNISVESEQGKGSTFTVTVTLMDTEQSSAEMEAADLTPAEMQVLVIDDDPIACEHAKTVLEKVGIAADTSLSGKEALEMVRLRHARMEPYNLILVDWKMPEMDGVETTIQIRSLIGDEPAIIILTAYSWDEILEEAKQAGVDSFLAKPLFAANVMDEFNYALEKKSITTPAVKTKADLRGRRILLAEDVAINAEIMTMLLQMKEMTVEHAENGMIAVDMFQTAEEGYYDAVLMDIRMPEMDGLTAASAIRAMDREDAKMVPIIALTANAFDEDVQRSLQAGLNAHLSKPVEPAHLYETLEELIRD